MINKLKFYGIEGPYNDSLKSYLTNRSCLTKIHDVLSNSNRINFGVPQGSILGPLLFSLYTYNYNDIKSLTENCEVSPFADDTSIFCSSDNYADLIRKCNQLLKKCQDWLTHNCLTLNIEKCTSLTLATLLAHQPN